MAVSKVLYSSNTSEVLIPTRQGGLLRNSFTLYAQAAAGYAWAAGAHIKLEVSPDGANWFETDVDMTAAGFATIQIRAAACRAKITSPSTDRVEVWLV